MKLFLTIASCIIALLLIVVVLLQQQGSGIGQAFGGGSAVYRTRRGAEKFLLWLTIILAILYAITAIATILVS